MAIQFLYMFLYIYTQTLIQPHATLTASVRKTEHRVNISTFQLNVLPFYSTLVVSTVVVVCSQL